VNNVVGLAKATKGFDLHTILTTVTEERGGYLGKRRAGCLSRSATDLPHDGISVESKFSGRLSYMPAKTVM
jgi:hypothetical protein